MPRSEQLDRSLPWRGIWTLLAVTAALLAVPASAGAHASLEQSVPAANEVVQVAPNEVRLDFSGTIVAGAGTIQVFAPDERDVTIGNPQPIRGSSITQQVEIDEPGTYGISYRVSSEDGHVITGAVTFSVGTASTGGGATDASENAAQVDRGLQVAFSIARFVEVLALLVAAGTGVFASLIVPGWRPRLLVASIVTLLLAYGTGYVINTAIVRGGGIGDALSLDALAITADTPLGLSLQIRAIIAFVALAPALLLRAGPSLSVIARGAVAMVFVGLAASMSITGHAVTTDPTWLRMPLDMVHVAAAAIWIGGLVQLAFLAPFAAAHVEAIARFSRIAFASVIVLLLTGLYATWAELGLQPGELLDARYGRLIVAKFVLYLGTMPLAWNNMSAFVPQVRRRPDDAPQMLRQYVWREFALLVVVVALTVWLIATPQPS